MAGNSLFTFKTTREQGKRDGTLGSGTVGLACRRHGNLCPACGRLHPVRRQSSFRAVGLTERTTRNSIWNDILEREAIDNQPVQVELADGRNVLGVLLYYSDSSEEGQYTLPTLPGLIPKGRQFRFRALAFC